MKDRPIKRMDKVFHKLAQNRKERSQTEKAADSKHSKCLDWRGNCPYMNGEGSCIKRGNCGFKEARQ